jgi:hypothetical protein
VYVPVPPDATTEAVPLQAPKQVTFTCDCVFVIGGLAVMLNVCVPWHPLAPVTVHVYVPAHKPEAEEALPPVGVHAYVNGPVPDTTVTVADPVQLPAQAMFVCVPERVSDVTVTVIVAETVAGTLLQFVVVC